MRGDEGDIGEKGFSLVVLPDPARSFLGRKKGLVSLVVDGFRVGLKILSVRIGEGREVAEFGVEVAIGAVGI